MKIYNILRRSIGTALIAASIFSFASCNKEEEGVEIYLTPSNVAVTSFVLNSDDNVMANLDSVFFSIDLENGVIFNADSLPVDTKIDKLVANIKYSSYITKATIKMEDGKTRTGEIDYMTTPGDSIDFTGKVTLTISTDDDTLAREYLIKVNVHKEKSDSLMWSDRRHLTLPSRLADPLDQKTLDFNGTTVTLIKENDGSYTYATSENLYDNEWQKFPVSFSFTPDVRSLCATSDALVILDTDGNMYESFDGSNWSATGETWSAMLGAYLDTAIGIKGTGSSAVYAQHPAKNLVVAPIDPDFPVAGYSNFEILANKWTSSPVGFFVGGVKQDGTLSNATWAFDGYNWIKLAEGGVPQLRGASLIPYYGFRFTQSSWSQTEYPVWMVIGGTLPDGTLNRTVYISYDNGVNWGEGSEALQLPEEMPEMTSCDNVVSNHRRNANLSDAWKKSTKSGHDIEIDGDIISWDCPYIYLFGGFDPDGVLYNSIWRGIVARLQFTPVI